MFPAVSATQRNEDVDARHKAGHDGGKVFANDQVICQANGDTR